MSTGKALCIAVLTLSDSRDETLDESGRTLAGLLAEDGHRLAERLLLPDDKYMIRKEISRWIADPEVEVVVTSGGTGITGRDITPEAVRPLLDREFEGFGEAFRWLSFAEIGVSTILSRALAGVANGTLIFCLPGSTAACRQGWQEILSKLLDDGHKPCNFARLIGRLRE